MPNVAHGTFGQRRRPRAPWRGLERPDCREAPPRSPPAGCRYCVSAPRTRLRPRLAAATIGRMQPPAGHVESLASQYVHVRVVLGMVVGLGLTHLLRHFARILDSPVRERSYWVHLLWAGSMFLYLLHFWWWEFRLVHTVQWTFLLYLFIAAYALLLYLLCAIIFPDSLEGYRNYEDYFHSRRKWFFGLLGLAYVVDLADTWIKGVGYFEGFGPELELRSLAYVVLCAIAMA